MTLNRVNLNYFHSKLAEGYFILYILFLPAAAKRGAKTEQKSLNREALALTALLYQHLVDTFAPLFTLPALELVNLTFSLKLTIHFNSNKTFYLDLFYLYYSRRHMAKNKRATIELDRNQNSLLIFT